jgi:hypothetical protein
MLSTKYILLKHGLANRLRTIIGYLYAGIQKKETYIFHWTINDDACNGKFSDIFLPLNLPEYGKVEIVECDEQKNIRYHFRGQDTIIEIIKRELPEEINKHNISILETKLYCHYIPKQHIMYKIFKVLEHQNSFVAMHIRRTDHIELAKRNNRFTGDMEFDFFVMENKNDRIFLTTDNKEIQDKYLKYNNIFVYKRITPNNNLRQTSLEDAVIDIFIASKSKKFKGSGWSSFSHLIEIFRRINN